MNSSEKNYHFE